MLSTFRKILILIPLISIVFSKSVFCSTSLSNTILVSESSSPLHYLNSGNHKKKKTLLVGPCLGGPDEVGGKVYREYKFNGIADASNAYRYAELGISNVSVKIYDENQTLITTVITDTNGNWSANAASASGNKVLIEFIIPSGFSSGPSGINNGSAVRIASKGTCNNDFTLGKIEDHCQDNPTIVTACFPGPVTGPNSTIVTISYQDSKNFTGNQNTYSYQGAYTTANSTTKAAIANESNTGFINGLAWDRSHNQVLSASFAKITSKGTSNTIGNIYKTTPTGATTVWLDLESIFANCAGGNLFQDGKAIVGTDPDVHNIGYIGFTDIEINPNDSEVYLFNAKDRNVYIVKVDLLTGAAITTNIKKVQIPAICTGNNANGFPYAVSGGLGYLDGRVYASTTCNGPTKADLQGAVYSFNPSDASPVIVQELILHYGTWTLPPVYIGGNPAFTSGAFLQNVLAPWSTGLSNVNSALFGGSGYVSGTGFSDFAPWAMDLEFDINPNGTVGMNIITKNRGVDASQTFNDPTNGGYMSKASGGVSGSWVLESGGVTGSYITGLNQTTPTSVTANTFKRGPVESKFFHGEGLEGPSANGGALVIPGFKEIMTSNTDNVYGDYDSGFSFHSVDNGLKTRDVNLLQGGGVGFAKGNSWGDLQAMAELAPIEIGNYVWLDVDKDGFQDPNELPQSNVPVQLWKDTNSDGEGDLLLGTATTNDKGLYYFGGATSANTSQKLVPFMTYELRISLASAKVAYAQIGGFTGYDTTLDQFDSDFRDTLISSQKWAHLTLKTSNTDLIHHQYDVGFFLTPLVTTMDTDITCGPVEEGGSMKVTAQFFSGPLTYDWDNNAYDGLSEIFNVPLGTYTVTVSDTAGNTASATTSITIEPCTPNPCKVGQLGGTVFNDPDANGVDNGDGGFKTVKVQIFKCDPSGKSVLVETVYTDGNGDYHFNDPALKFGNSEKYRVEFSKIPDMFTSSKQGSDNGTETQYVSALSCEVDYGLVNPCEYCGTDPQIGVVCFNRNNDANSEPNLIFIRNRAGKIFTASNDTDLNREWAMPAGANLVTYPLTHQAIATKEQLNTTFGLTWSKKHSTLFSGAYMRAFAPMGANSSSNGFAESAIYAVPFNNEIPQTPQVWLDLESPSMFGNDFAGQFINDNVYPGPLVFGTTSLNPNSIGYTGLGSMKISKDNSEMYVVNLKTREVLVIPINADGSAPSDVSSIKKFPIPNTNCTGAWPDGRLHYTALGLGVHPITGRVYATATCTGPTKQDLTGFVYSFDPKDTSPSSADFTLELEIPLDFTRPATNPNIGIWYAQVVHPWETIAPNTTFYSNGSSTSDQHSQPWLGEIEFDRNTDGSYGMIMAERNRYHDVINSSFYVTGGTILRACNSGTIQNPIWNLENSGSCGNYTSAVNWTTNGTAGRAGTYTTPSNRFFKYVGAEGTMGAGTLTMIQGSGEIILPVMDNVFYSGTSGVTWLNTKNGDRARDNRILSDFTSNGYGNTNFTKSNNWGGVVAMCPESPIQLGNYVWIDSNADGIQDPCETPIASLKVKLYTKPSNGNAKLVASTTTNAKGEYYFSSSTDTDELWETGFKSIQKDSSYYIVFCGDGYNATTNVITNKELLFSVTTANTGMGINPAFNDSDGKEFTIQNVGDFPAICVKVDSINHTFDVGLLPKPDLALIQVLDSSNNIASIKFGDLVKFKMIVFNQSLASVDSVEITDYLPAGFTFNPNTIGNESWKLGLNGKPTALLKKVISAGGKDSLCIFLKLIKTTDPNNWVNVVEISKAYKNGLSVEDCDSPLDSNPNNNGGGQINTPADDYIKGNGTAKLPNGIAATDQDNVDPATVPICDLALVNKLQSIHTNVKIGDTLKYLVIVHNQGSVTGDNIDIKYYIPLGLKYLPLNNSSSPSWTVSGNVASAKVTDDLLLNKKDTICIYLKVQGVTNANASADSWTTKAEIARYESPDAVGTAKTDLDSNPDTDPTNDPGGNPDDATNDVTSGDGTGDPAIPIQDVDPLLDEDDEDAEIIYLCDVASIIYTKEVGPHKYGDTIKYVVDVYNQGNGAITKIVLQNIFGDGLKFINTPQNLSAGWTVDGSNQLKNTLMDLLDVGDTAKYCLELEIQQDLSPTKESWLVEIEVVSFETPNASGITKSDIDSNPDNNPTNDSGGNPKDATNNTTNGDGSGNSNIPSDDANPTKDEDDQDTEIIGICDFAIKKIIKDNRPYAVGDTVVFDIMVFNQGNVDGDNIEITDYIRSGFVFPGAINPDWSTVGSNLVFNMLSLPAGTSDTIQLRLITKVDSNPDLSDWWNYVEVSKADDDNNSGNTPPLDADSDLDNIVNNDNAMVPDDAQDNVIDENGLKGDDEDDIDAAKVIVGYDLALRKTVSPAGPYKYGDTLTYTISVINQGGLTVSNVAVYDTIPCGLRYIASNNSIWAYTNQVAKHNITSKIAPGITVSRTLKLVVQPCAVSAYKSYYNIAEINNFKDEFGDTPSSDDYDSSPDFNPNNNGNEIDNTITDTTDEDDSDFEDIDICDLALIIKKADIALPPHVGDTVKYYVIVKNQGNENTQAVSIDLQLPNGLAFLPVNNDLTPSWTKANMTLAKIVSANIIAPTESDTLCIYLKIQNVPTGQVTPHSWTTIAEITKYQNGEEEVKTTDADSKPDANPSNDPGGNPDDSTNDVTDGNGQGDPNDPIKDINPVLDEDDNDADIVEICDVATIIYTDDKGPHAYGDTIKYIVEIHNQGNGDITNVSIQDIIGDGLMYIDNAVNNAAGWDEVSKGKLENTIIDVITPGDTMEVCVYFKIIPDLTPDKSSWQNNVEVVSYEDPAAPSVSKPDLDSTPDGNPTNDSGGNPDDATDDVTNGTGEGDPMNPTDDGNPVLDEDDQDVEDIKIFDLALIIQIDSMPPVLPVVPGNEIKFRIIVENQANTTANLISIVNHIMQQNLILSDNPKNVGWTNVSPSKNKFTLAGPLKSGERDTICIYHKVVGGAMTDITTWAEVSTTKEVGQLCIDADSDYDENNQNDSGGNVKDGTDDVLYGNGQGNPTIPDEDSNPIFDEDDHDVAPLDAFDLALIIYHKQTTPIQIGDEVKYFIEVLNQGNFGADSIDLLVHIPDGFKLSTNTLNVGWQYATPHILKYNYNKIIPSHDSTLLCLFLEVLDGTNALDYMVYAEVGYAEDESDRDMSNLDIDSKYDNLLSNDSGGKPGSGFEDGREVAANGEDNQYNESGVINDDEDDQDPAWVPVLDLATMVTIPDRLPVLSGDNVTFCIKVINQGNLTISSFVMGDYIPAGFVLSPQDTSGWYPKSIGYVQKIVEQNFKPNDTIVVKLLLKVKDKVTVFDLVDHIEIFNVIDSLKNDVTDFDIDSDPDDSKDNDAGGHPYDSTNDETEDSGKSGKDEDDQDPAVPPVFDLAIRLTSPTDVPVKTGDTVKFTTVIYNQGNVDATNIDVTNYIPAGIDFLSSPKNIGWTLNPLDSTAEFTYADTLKAFTSDTICIFFLVNKNATPINVVDMTEISYAEDTQENDLSLFDIDGELDNSNKNDKGNDIYSEEDNKLMEFGKFGGDEDDHDQAFLNVCGGIACNGGINYSLDENCEIAAKASIFLTGDLYPDKLYTVSIVDDHGKPHTNTFTRDDLGKAFKVSICLPLCDNICCWTTMKVEDKYPPKVICINDTISCVAPLSSIKKPIILDNCGGSKLVLLSEVPTNLNCDANFISKIIRVWTAVDAYGNKGDTCTQEIYIKRTNTSNIQWPRNITLSCTSFTTPYPPLSLTGVPTLDGFSLHPLNQTVICNGFSLYTDTDIITAECKRIIQRLWEVGEWWCNSTNIKTWVQIIEVKDDVAPVIVPLTPIIVSTGSGSCKASFNLPKATITDNCNTNTVKISTGESVLNTNGGPTQLSVGNHVVTYTATDLCGNQSTATLRVTVQDLIEPISICNTNTVVSLKDDGTAWMDKFSADNGSFDECGPVELKIRRMTSTCDTTSTKWVDEVGFCCADVGKEIMVALLVTDAGGKSNQCMVRVIVQDRRIATLACPPNRTVDCITAYDPANLGAAFGNTIVSGGGCASNANVTEILTGQLNSCLIGELTRTFTLKQNEVVTGTCEQTITFTPTVPFNESMIRYPRDTTYVNAVCSPLDLDPSALPIKYGKPQLINEGVCDLVASSFTDDVYSFNGNGACYKIVRHWTVINWCFRVEGKIWQRTFDQVLVVMNTEAPTVTSATTKREICSYNIDCTPVAIKLDASATDDCTPVSELKWRWTITFKNGTKKLGLGRDASDTYAFGLHHIDFEVEDKCGNIAYTGYDFEVKSCKAPIAYCKQGLSTNLVAMDTDNNGIPDAEMSILKPSFFDNGSSQSCGNSYKLSFSANLNDTTLIVSCAEKNKNAAVQLWVTDQNGNTSFCKTFVNVQDNNTVNICPNTTPIDAGIAGKVSTTDGQSVKAVTVKLSYTEERLSTTDGEGKYVFDQVELDGSYKVIPLKSDDVLNGVSTLDLVLIQRHILGATKLTDPYKILAADVNKDGKITASDLVMLRKLILGSESKMADDESWRFLVEGQVFGDPSHPMTSQLIQTYDIAKLEGDMEINFVGLKVGDVNGSVVANAAAHIAEPRSIKEMEMYYDDKEVKVGDRHAINIKLSEATKLQGMQTTLHTKGMKVINVSGEEIGMNNIHSIAENVYTMSYNTKGGKTYASNGLLLSIEVEVTESGLLSNMLWLDNDRLQTEAYIGEDAELAKVTLRAKGANDQSKFELGQNIPNPWQNTTVIPITLPENGDLTYSIKDNSGRTIMTRSQVLDKGKHTIELNKNNLNLGNGSFIFEAIFNNDMKSIQMIRID